MADPATDTDTAPAPQDDSLLGSLFGPTQAQQAMAAAGNYTDPSILQADRASAWGRAAMAIDKLGRTGAGPGALLRGADQQSVGCRSGQRWRSGC